jgi:hypothetical protein
MAVRPEGKEYYAYLTVHVPISVLERLRPYAIRRAKSEFVTAAITAALDKADQDREPAEAAS